MPGRVGLRRRARSSRGRSVGARRASSRDRRRSRWTGTARPTSAARSAGTRGPIQIASTRACSQRMPRVPATTRPPARDDGEDVLGVRVFRRRRIAAIGVVATAAVGIRRRVSGSVGRRGEDGSGAVLDALAPRLIAEGGREHAGRPDPERAHSTDLADLRFESGVRVHGDRRRRPASSPARVREPARTAAPRGCRFLPGGCARLAERQHFDVATFFADVAHGFHGRRFAPAMRERSVNGS